MESISILKFIDLNRSGINWAARGLETGAV